MSERTTPEADALLTDLDEWIEDALKHSTPIGIALTRARSRIKDQHDRIAEMWDALEHLRRERDEARERAAKLAAQLLAEMESTK